MSRGMSKSLRDSLFDQSRNRCAICGSDVLYHLQLAHMQPARLGGLSTSDNMIVLCFACHMAVDSLPVSASILEEIKRDWIEKHTLGAKRINQLLSIISKSSVSSTIWSLLPWADALKESRTFDTAIEEAQSRLQVVRNEDEFIHSILWPLFVSLGFEEVTVIHHSGEQEQGKDMVFYRRDSLGSFTVYAVVACCKKIHTNSSRTSDAGHYAKLIDQVRKCYSTSWHDHHLKRDTFIDKVIIATPFTITGEAMREFRSWEEANKRQLIYLYHDRIVGIMARIKMGPSFEDF